MQYPGIPNHILLQDTDPCLTLNTEPCPTSEHRALFYQKIQIHVLPLNTKPCPTPESEYWALSHPRTLSLVYQKIPIHVLHLNIKPCPTPESEYWALFHPRTQVLSTKKYQSMSYIWISNLVLLQDIEPHPTPGYWATSYCRILSNVAPETTKVPSIMSCRSAGLVVDTGRNWRKHSCLAVLAGLWWGDHYDQGLLMKDILSTHSSMR